jgi:phage baseplate assembly protein W
MKMGKAEICFKSCGTQVGDPSLLKTVDPKPYGIKTPVQLGEGRSGIFQMHFNPVEQIDDNLKNLILTNSGERLGNYGYGANLRPLVAEVSAREDFDAMAMDSISRAVQKYMPFVELSTFSSDFGGTDGATPGGQDGVPLSMTRVDLLVKFSVPKLRIGERALNVSLLCIG